MVLICVSKDCLIVVYCVFNGYRLVVYLLFTRCVWLYNYVVMDGLIIAYCCLMVVKLLFYNCLIVWFNVSLLWVSGLLVCFNSWKQLQAGSQRLRAAEASHYLSSERVWTRFQRVFWATEALNLACKLQSGLIIG